LAVSPDGEQWLVVNASPDLRQQIAETPALQPRESPRHSPIDAVLLTNGDVDHVAGLLSLRESQPFRLFATREVLDGLGQNRIFNVAHPDLVSRHAVTLNEFFEPLAGLSVILFPVPGKIPLWLEEGDLNVGATTESTVGVTISVGGKRMTYVPGCAAVTSEVRDRIAGADILLFDGTVWRDDEMISAGVGQKTGRRMGHLPMSGHDGSIAALAGVRVGRRVFVHLNNTNATLIEGSTECRQAEEAGWEIGYDGMVLT
jgi:pyrroloquinoline quinone biosynthesis protein B